MKSNLTVENLIKGIAILLMSSVPVWLLWNDCLVGAVTGVNDISWLQCLGIMVLINLAVKSPQLTVKKETL